jgi:ketosteroid isomerase-like protein
MALKHLLTLAVVLVAQVASAESASSLRGQLERRYAVLKTAFQSKDEAAIRSVLADGFVDVDVTGKSHNAAEMMKGLLAIPDDPNRELQITILSVSGDGRTAVVKQRSDTTTKLKDTDASEKPARASAFSTDNWVSNNGSWRLARTVMTRVDGTIDGKLIVHKRNPTAQ